MGFSPSRFVGRRAKAHPTTCQSYFFALPYPLFRPALTEGMGRNNVRVLTFRCHRLARWNLTFLLGLRLVQMLAGQLHAVVEVSSNGGTEFTVTFEAIRNTKS